MTKMQDPIEKLRGRLLCNATVGMNNFEYESGDAIADEIEAAYMKSPVDADGVPIRPGDTVECDTFGGGECAVLAVAGDFWVDIYGFTHKPEVTRHVKPATVESLLEEFAEGIEAFDANYVDAFAKRIREAVEK